MASNLVIKFLSLHTWHNLIHRISLLLGEIPLTNSKIRRNVSVSLISPVVTFPFTSPCLNISNHPLQKNLHKEKSLWLMINFIFPKKQFLGCKMSAKWKFRKEAKSWIKIIKKKQFLSWSSKFAESMKSAFHLCLLSKIYELK